MPKQSRKSTLLPKTDRSVRRPESATPRDVSALVNHPVHYGGDVPHEVMKCLEAWGLEFDALLWNAVKYIARSGKKGSAITDLEKARFYIDRRIETLRAAAGLSQCPAKTKERP